MTKTLKTPQPLKQHFETPRTIKQTLKKHQKQLKTF